jgi:hypothetical protein
MKAFTFIAAGVIILSQSAFAADQSCSINGSNKTLPAKVGSKNLSFHVAYSAGARMALVKSLAPTSLEVSSSLDDLQIIGLYASGNENDETAIHCYAEGKKQICSVSTEEKSVEVPGSFEVKGIRFDVSIKDNARIIKVETNRALDITSTTGQTANQIFSVKSNKRKIEVNCPAFVNQKA